MFKTKRVYEKPESGDGFRILVDRLWPRGLTKEEARVDLWLKEMAPSDKLRKWFSHEPQKWPEFRKRYFLELNGKKEVIAPILEKVVGGKTITLLFGAKDEKFNNALALKEYLEKRQQW